MPPAERRTTWLQLRCTAAERAREQVAATLQALSARQAEREQARQRERDDFDLER